MMENVEKLIRERRSVRTFDGRALSPEDREKLMSFARQIENPWNIPVEFALLDAKEDALTSPVIVGAEQYIGAKVKKGPGAEEAFGYSFELLVLYAQSLGVGTTWIGGTMDRPAFERAMKLEDDAMMPCVTPVGYPAAKMSVRETMMRKGVRADTRAEAETLFFEDTFSTPLTGVKAGKLSALLESVRLAPSAVNKQPWRVLICGDTVHFYKKGGKGFQSASTGDLQKVDLGIAMCHFALAAQEQGITLSFLREAPNVEVPADMTYIASYHLA